MRLAKNNCHKIFKIKIIVNNIGSQKSQIIPLGIDAQVNPLKKLNISKGEESITFPNNPDNFRIPI